MTTKDSVPAEKRVSAIPGLPIVIAMLVAGAVGFLAMVTGRIPPLAIPVLGVVGFITFFIVVKGTFVIAPNEGRVLLLFGEYKGTVVGEGMWFVNPLKTRIPVSLRAMSFETNRLKVNDLDGNPVEIAAVVVYRIVYTAKASFAVDDPKQYIQVQSESGLRSLATHYPYDSEHHDTVSLRGSIDVVADRLKHELQQRVALAGLEVVEARISYLGYAPEIAHAMLQRQQAAAIIAARTKIVEGAVTMVQSALEMLAEKNVVRLDEERKAQMVANSPRGFVW
jgi:regulator of protease activity HflC (stomatin/prohibitin superfamily)